MSSEQPEEARPPLHLCPPAAHSKEVVLSTTQSYLAHANTHTLLLGNIILRCVTFVYAVFV